MGKIVGNQIIGKVKTVTVEKQPTENEMGLATFDFRDEYSVFDYGRMPDDIPTKGEALCRMSAQNFKELQNAGIKTHFIKSVTPKSFQVKTVRILYPQKGEVKNDSTNFLIPLEIMFRNMLPEGSSMLKRLRSGSIKPEDIGLSEIPKPYAMLDTPIIDYTTKLEGDDRHLTKKEAQELAMLSNEEFAKMETTALKVNNFLNKKAEKVGLVHADGKIEMALDPNREIMLVDTFGTLDEDRFLFGRTQLSKQLLRDYYALTQWEEEVQKKEDGKEYKLNEAKPLPKDFLEIITNMYRSVCEEWTGEKTWGAPSVESVVNQINEYMKKLKE